MSLDRAIKEADIDVLCAALRLARHVLEDARRGGDVWEQKASIALAAIKQSILSVGRPE
ncbi:hypothetical protein [Tardiphaga sp. 841_E9_N1_2]|uniref:hypothetical protein n=1 Tax=Tardiphaga sp. 841_E9_N1_2 TaxID=3240762 RepID=UPI003F210281